MAKKTESTVLRISARSRCHSAHGILAILGVAGVECYLLATMGGSAFDLKTSALGAERVRPLSNLFVISYAPVAMLALLVCWMKFRAHSALVLAAILIVLESLSGSRGSMLGAVFTLMLLLAGRSRSRIKLPALILTVVLFAGAVLSVEMAKGSHRDVTAGDRIVYGNDFSDVRDFAFILSRWDRQPLYGKTYLAGLLGFIPRWMVPYREEYSIATYMNRIVGLKKDTHGGLRPGPFGEAYLNFGYPGVIVLGTILGIILGFVRSQLDWLRAMRVSDMAILTSQTASLYLFSALAETSDVWAYYVFLVMGFGSILFTRTLRLQNRRVIRSIDESARRLAPLSERSMPYEHYQSS